MKEHGCTKGPHATEVRGCIKKTSESKQPIEWGRPRMVDPLRSEAAANASERLPTPPHHSPVTL